MAGVISFTLAVVGAVICVSRRARLAAGAVGRGGRYGRG